MWEFVSSLHSMENLIGKISDNCRFSSVTLEVWKKQKTNLGLLTALLSQGDYQFATWCTHKVHNFTVIVQPFLQIPHCVKFHTVDNVKLWMAVTTNSFFKYSHGSLLFQNFSSLLCAITHNWRWMWRSTIYQCAKLVIILNGVGFTFHSMTSIPL